MAAAPRLTPQEWANVREAWENDSRDSFEWLVRELGLHIAGAAVRKRAKVQAWKKAGKPDAGADLGRAKAQEPKRAENALKKAAATPRQYKRDPRGRGSVVGESKGGEQSPPKGFKGEHVSEGGAKRRQPQQPMVIDMATGKPEGSGGDQGSQAQGSHHQGSRHKWTMNLGSGEELWRDTVPMVPVKGEDGGRGRPTTYQKLFAHQAFMFCLKGATNDVLAELFQVSVRTINRWLNDHKEFCHAVMAGRKRADAQVAMSLYQRAIGMVVPKAHVSNYKGSVTITELQEYLPPDVGAASLWLFNRDPENWRANVELPAPDAGSNTPFEDELDAFYAQSMEASKVAAEAARADRERHGLFGKRAELDSQEEEQELLPASGDED